MKLLRCEKGDINLPVLALALPIFLMLVAAAIDLARVPLMQRRLQNALAYAAMNLKPVKSVRCDPEVGGFPKNCIPIPPDSPDSSELLQNSLGIEPFFPAVYALSDVRANPARELSSVPDPSSGDSHVNPGCKGLVTEGVPENEHSFLCPAYYNDQSCNTTPCQLSRLAVSMVYRQLFKEPFDGWHSDSLSLNAGIVRQDLVPDASSYGYPNDKLVPIGAEYTWNNWGAPFEASAKLQDIFGFGNVRGFTNLKIGGVDTDGENIWLKVNPNEPVAWEIEGACGSQPDCPDRYLPPAYMVLLGFARIKAYFGTFALFGGSNERWVAEYYILPLQRIYDFSEGYRP